MTMFSSFWMANAGADAYSVDNSVVLNEPDDEYFTRTPSSASNQKTWTFSTWIKRGELGSDQRIFTATNNGCELFFDANDKLNSYQYTSGSYVWNYISTQVFRDPHAWYHLVVRIDTTQASSGDRVRLYVNGEQITDFDTSTAPSQDATGYVNSAVAHYIGRYSGSNSMHYDGYLAETVLIDGSSLAPTSFGETDDNGVWRPISIEDAGLTFGTNGFYLRFTNSAGLGQDYSGSTSTTVVQKNTYNAGSEINDGDAGANPSTGMLFTAPVSGTVSKIELNASSRGFSGVTVRLETDGGSGTAPSGTIVTNGEVTGITSSGAGLKTATFSTPPEVVAGTKYWIVLRGDTGTWGWQHDVSGVGPALGLYQGGQGYYSGRGVGHYVYMTGNHWEAVNSPTQATDTPTDNRAVITPLATSASLSKGNLTVNTTTGAGQSGKGSIPCVVGDGNDYVFEAKLLAKSGSGNPFIGVADQDSPTLPATSDYRSYASGSHWLSDGQLDGLNASHSYGSQEKAAGFSDTFTTNDVIGVVVKNSGAVHFYKNGSQVFVSSDQTNISVLPAGDWFPSFGQATGGGQTSQWEFRFGDDMSHSYGTAVKLTTSTLNLAQSPTIEDGSAYHQTTLYSGNSSTQTITQSGFNSTFQPDLIWGKQRTGSQEPTIFDAVRGTTKYIQTNSTAGEATQSGVTAFNSNGFNLGSWAVMNQSSNTHVAWQWLAGNSTSSNGNGSITSTVSVNQTAGFSIVTYTGTGSAATVGHGLGSTPSWILVKKLNASVFWAVYHAANTSAPETEYLKLNATDATADDAGYWNDTAPTSSVFSINNESAVNTEDGTYVAYCWCEKPGFSKFGSYEGNGNANGPYIPLGFKPAFLMVKNIDAAGGWPMYDNARTPGNPSDKNLNADQNGAEYSPDYEIDLLSNGFKIRDNQTYVNAANTYIYMAFAEHPFAGTTPATAR